MTTMPVQVNTVFNLFRVRGKNDFSSNALPAKNHRQAHASRCPEPYAVQGGAPGRVWLEELGGS